MCPLQERSMVSLASPGWWWGRRLFLSNLLWRDASESAVSISGLSRRRCGHCGPGIRASAAGEWARARTAEPGGKIEIAGTGYSGENSRGSYRFIYIPVWGRKVEKADRFFSVSSEEKRNRQKFRYRKFNLNIRKKLFYAEGGQALEPGSPERLWSLHQWKYLTPSETWPWAACCSWHCLE